MVTIPPSKIISLQLRKEESMMHTMMYNKNMQLKIRTINAVARVTDDVLFKRGQSPSNSVAMINPTL